MKATDFYGIHVVKDKLLPTGVFFIYQPQGFDPVEINEGDRVGQTDYVCRRCGSVAEMADLDGLGLAFCPKCLVETSVLVEGVAK